MRIRLSGASVGSVWARSGFETCGDVLPPRIRLARLPRAHARDSARPPPSGRFRLADCARPNRSPSPNRAGAGNGALALPPLQRLGHEGARNWVRARAWVPSTAQLGDSAQPSTLNLPPCDRRVRGRSGMPTGHTCGWSARLGQRRRAERDRHPQVESPPGRGRRAGPNGRGRRTHVFALSEAVTAGGNRPLGKVATPGRRAASSERVSSRRAKPSPQVETGPWARSPRRVDVPRQANARRRAERDRHRR